MQVLEKGVDVQANTFLAGPRKSEMLVMVRGMSYTPNVLGARFLVREVLPRVWARRRDVHLYIVGKDPAPEVRVLAGRGVTVTGAVPDVRPYLERAILTVVPVLRGGGTRLKILEAMAAGVPVVTTPDGAAGLELRHGEEAWVFRSAAEMAEAILMLLSDPARARRMAVAARSRVERDYDWRVIGLRFVALLEGLVAREIPSRSAVR